MNYEDFLAIERRISTLREQFVDSQYGRIPQSIEYLQHALDSAASPADKSALYPLLLAESLRFGNEELHVHFLRQQVEALPDSLFPLTSLATGLARNSETQSEALAVAAAAVSRAKQQDRQVKYSLTCQARVAIEVGDYSTLSAALRGLIDDASNHRGYEDHGYEFDFLDQLDPTRVDPELISKYRALQQDGRNENVLSNELLIVYDPVSQRLSVHHPDKTRFKAPLLDVGFEPLQGKPYEDVAERIGKILMLLIPEFRATFPMAAGVSGQSQKLEDELIDFCEARSKEDAAALYDLATNYLVRARLQKSADDLDRAEVYLRKAAELGSKRAKLSLEQDWEKAKKMVPKNKK